MPLCVRPSKACLGRLGYGPSPSRRRKVLTQHASDGPRPLCNPEPHIVRFQFDPWVTARSRLATILWLQGYPDQAVSLRPGQRMAQSRGVSRRPRGDRSVSRAEVGPRAGRSTHQGAHWAFHENRIAVRFAYEWHDDSGQWFRSYGNENWEFDGHGLMSRRIASINDLPIQEADRKYRWRLGRRPDDHPGLSDLGL
jgi:hypothetical protein